MSIYRCRPVAAPEKLQPSFAANWYVSGIGRLGDQDFVTVKSRDLSTQFSLYGNELNPKEGVTLVSINWSETVGKSTVLLKKGAETATLEFNEAEVHGPPKAPAGANPNVAGQPLNSTPPGGPAGKPVGNPLAQGPGARSVVPFPGRPAQAPNTPTNPDRNPIANGPARGPNGVQLPRGRNVIAPQIQVQH